MATTETYVITHRDGERIGAVRAAAHRQHIYSETTLLGVARSAARKLRAWREAHGAIYTAVGGRQVRVAGAEEMR